jgi:hypothetical protein
MSFRLLTNTSKTNKEKVQHVSREELVERPYPVSMGRFHQPVKYSDIIGVTDEALERHGLETKDTEFILARDGKLLIASYTLNGNSAMQLPNGLDNDAALVIMASEKQLTACKGRVGSHIFACDNLMLSGGQIVIAHKFTTRAQILNRMWAGIQGWVDSKAAVERRLHELQATNLNDGQASKQILEVAAGDPSRGTRGVVPFKYAQKAYDEYFAQNGPDTEPRTEWGLYNSWTRALREAPAQSKMASTVAVSGYYRV